MTGGQDDAANLIHSSDGMTWDRFHGIRADNIALKERLRLCRELLATAVEAWESIAYPNFVAPYRRPVLSSAWLDKAKEAIGER